MGCFFINIFSYLSVDNIHARCFFLWKQVTTPSFVLYDDETHSICKDSYSTNNLCSGWRQERAHLKMIKLTLICHLKGCISAINPKFVCLHPISTVIIINVVVVIIIVTFVIIISSISSKIIIANTDFLLWTFQVWSQEPFYGKHQSENISILIIFIL